MEVPKHWRLQEQRLTLTGDRCKACNIPTFPKRDICPKCSFKNLLEKRAKNIYQSEGSTSQTPRPAEIIQD